MSRLATQMTSRSILACRVKGASPQQQAKNGKPQSRPVKSKPPATSPQSRLSAILWRTQLEQARDVLGPPVDASKLGYVRFKVPELDGQDGWLNSPPLTMSQLRGKVIALHFWTFG